MALGVSNIPRVPFRRCPQASILFPYSQELHPKKEKDVPQGIFVINPGATSTKVAVFDGEKEVWRESVRHDPNTLNSFVTIAGQLDYRYQLIAEALPAALRGKLEVVVGRGGLLRPLEGGIYSVDSEMLEDAINARYGEHASNLGPMLAHRFASELGLPACVVDPVTTDEFPQVARISGVPGIERKCRSHALNMKAVARRTARKLNKPFPETRFVVAHLGGGISIGALHGGRIVDVNDGLLGMGPFSPERAGALPLQGVMDFVRDKGYDETKRIFSRESGFMGFLGTSSLEEVEAKIDGGDEQAKLVYDAMVYQIAKEIGAMTAALMSRVDAIILTGGLANSKRLVNDLKDSIEPLAPVVSLPGEEEMLALAEGGLRFLNGEETAKAYGVSR
jgi:butyrate kinase